MAATQWLSPIADEPTPEMPNANDTKLPPVRIALWDSGVGGLTVLAALWRTRPHAEYHYFADNAYAPYGERTDAEIRARADAVAQWCESLAAQALVVACNTATAAAVEHLRRRLALPVVGMEPGLKPASRLTRNGRIGILATMGTLNSERFRALRERYAQGVTVFIQPCPELVMLAEGGEIAGSAARAAAERAVAPLIDRGVDTVVLGCTHFPLFRAPLRSALGEGVSLVDTATAVARHTLSTVAVADGQPGAVRLCASAEAVVLEALATRLLEGAHDTATAG